MAIATGGVSTTQFDLTKESGANPLEHVGTNDKHWLEETYEGYSDSLDEWVYADDWYTGAVAKDDKIGDYLIRRVRAEHINDYNERKKIAAAIPYVSSVIDSLNGMVFAVEEDAQREWHEPEQPETGLGDPEVRGTPAYRLLHNTDGAGTAYNPFWQRVGINLLKFTKVYILIEGVSGSGEPRMRMIPPMSVTNYFDDNGLVTDYIVKHYGFGRTSVRDPWEKRQRYTHYALDGWTTYEKNDDDFRVVDEAPYVYFTTREREQRTLPIFQLCLPLSRNVAYNAARQANRIFNMESEQQAAMRKGQLPRLVLRTNDLEEHKKFMKQSKDGGNVMVQDPSDQKEHYYLLQPTDAAQLANEVILRHKEAFYETTFQNFADAVPRQKTATQIRQESRASLETILTLLSDTLDEGENRAIHLMEQTEFPNDASRWGVFHVHRSKRFEPVDADGVVASIKKTYFGNDTVPIDEAGMTDAAEKIADHYGITYNSDKLAEAVQEKRDQSAVDAPFI